MIRIVSHEVSTQKVEVEDKLGYTFNLIYRSFADKLLGANTLIHSVPNLVLTSTF